MNVLFISYDGLTDPLGQSQIIPYIAGLQNNGYKYTVLSFEKEDRFKANQAAVNILLKRQNISWDHHFYTKKPPVLSTLKDLKKMRRAIERFIEKYDCKILHCRSYPGMFAAYPLAKKHNLKIIFDMRGFWIDERVEGGIWKLSNPIYSFIYRRLKKLEKRWMAGSDLIISLTQKGKDLITSTFTNSDPNTIHVIPCCGDESVFDPEKIEEEEIKNLKSKLGIQENEKVLLYSGSIGTWYMADEMMQQFARLQKNSIMDKFLWLTLEDKETIVQLATKYGVNKEDIVVKSVKRNDMPLYLSMADIGIFYILPSFSKSASSPTKLAEILLMGIPVICNSGVGDLDYFFSKNNVGVCHDVNDLKLLTKEAIQKVYDLNSSDIRKTALDNLSLEKGIHLYSKALNSLQ